MDGVHQQVVFYGVVSEFLEEAVELYCTREEAEAVVRAWDEDEPDEAGTLRIEPVELATGGRN
jgi:hypothetical protein